MSATFRREIGALAEVFDLIEAFFTRERIDPEMRFPVGLAVEEIFTNLVKYNPEGRSGIGVRLSLDDDELKMALTDFDSRPFDVNTEAPEVDVDEPLENRKRGGLGVLLVKKMMDRVEYEHTSPVSTITMYKRVG